ncbi:bifunctional lysylphosphatidylglycerol flippase/synthetase MprF [Prauserella cavernicola]|uniref:DUF2156 domain-containing protein n=1 Tax=Prauserella cavernicola TaxID=2800127 RepID=A0A934QWR7_9PSEU|nr:DUF2156 domain-containing protein [Prauserella cavernicola]MBK1787577.1 DUF2156 domain-containing protein [Prauserella cavernicola]
MRVVRRVPFTITFLAILVVAGLATGSLWTAVEDRSWFADVAFGLPSFEDGHWWTPVTGVALALTPVYYVPVLLSFALFVGVAETRLGTKRTIATFAGGHLVGVFGAAAVLFALRAVSSWADAVGAVRDVGPSAGAFAALTAATATLRSPWRLRLRIALVAYSGIALLYGGTLADVEHAVAVAVVLPLSAWIAGPYRVTSRGRPSRREWRLLAAAGLLVVAAVRIVTWFFPADGPLGPTGTDSSSLAEVVVVTVLALLVVRGLSRGRRVAWWAAVVVASVDILLTVLTGIVLVVVYSVAGAEAISDVPLVVSDSVFWLGYLVLLLAGRGAFQVPWRPRTDGSDRDRAVELLRRNGGGTLSWMTTWPENRYLPVADDTGYIAYRRHAGVAIALGDPVSTRAEGDDPIAEFAEHCDRAGLVPCLFSATTPSVLGADRLGWRHVRIAEDTLIDLPGLEFRGRHWQQARTALHRAAREGVSFRLVHLADEPRAILQQVRAISEEWVGDKGLPEMGFTLGGVDEALDRHVRAGLAVDDHDRVHGVTSWMPVYAGEGRIEGWTLDVMRRRTGGFTRVVEFLIVSACQAFRDEGARYLSLSGAPLARADAAGDTRALDALLDKLGAALEPYYGFRSLHAFKAKFRPRYAPMYLIYRDEGDLPRIGLAIARAYLPEATLRDLPRLVRP